MAVSGTLCFFLFSVFFVHLAFSSPLPPDENESVDHEEDDFFEGDIILLPHQRNYKTKGQPPKTLISDPTAIWPDNTIYYEFAPGEFSQVQQNTIHDALNDLMALTCVRFTVRSIQPTYVVLRNNGRGCAAAVGNHGLGPLDLYLGGPACQTRGTIQHEFLHALGFWHEHTRTDRDDHITIVWSNISPGKEFNFDKRDPSEIMTLNMPYDYGSVMHYRSVAFSKDLVSTTIIPKDPSATSQMGQRIRFSHVDLAKLNRLYNCPVGYYRGEELEGKGAVVGSTKPPHRQKSDQNHSQEEAKTE